MSLGAGGRKIRLSSDTLTGSVLDNIANAHRQGSGFNPLCLMGQERNLFNDGAVGLNFEHIFDGCRENDQRAMFTPRTDPMHLQAVDQRTTRLIWPRETSSWDIGCSLTYCLDPSSPAVDMQFEAQMGDTVFSNGWCAMMWASYMHDTRDRTIHFIGQEEGEELWMSFGDEAGGRIETGTIGYRGSEPLSYESGCQTLNVIEHPTKRFAYPFYYGLMDYPHPDEPDLPMAYLMMFDQAESIRFAMWNFICGPDGLPDTRHPAWDWQFVIRDPIPERIYGYRARVELLPFRGQDEVLKRYRAWKASL